MVGRPVKPLPPSVRGKHLDQLRADLSNAEIATARETVEKALGRPVTDMEWLAIQIARDKG